MANFAKGVNESAEVSAKAKLAEMMAKKRKRNKQPSAFTKAVGETGSLPGGSSMGAKKPAFFTDQIRI